MNRILFVDDDEKILSSYKKIFETVPDSELLSGAADFLEDVGLVGQPEKENYIATYCSQGEDAVLEVEKSVNEDNPIKVVFLDMRMPPGIDGAETAKRIHSIDPDIEIVIVSAYSDTDIKDFSIKSGRPEKILFLRKPFDKKEIMQFALNLVSKYDLNCVKDDFLSHVSHELKTPLSSVLGFAQLLEDDPSISGEAREFSSLIAENAALMDQLLEDLFTVVASKNNEIRMDLQMQDIKKEITRIYELNKSRGDENVKFRIEIIGDKEMKIEMDSTRFIQAVNNLISNSFKFTSEGEVVLKLEIVDNGAVVSLRDTGVGISEERIKTIEDNFERGGGYNDVPGLGLGFSIFKMIMDRHKYKYQIKSKLGEGTCVSIFMEAKG